MMRSPAVGRALKNWQLAPLLAFSMILGGCSSSGGGEDEFVVLKPEVPASQKQPRAFSVAKPYNASSPYGGVLKDCYKATNENECTLGTLPLLGQAELIPSIENIMDRVIVTHDWMGVRFEQILMQYSDEELGLFKPVAIIYIGSELDFTGYTSARAALEIGAEVVWLTADEKKAIPAAGGGGGGDGGSSARPRDELLFNYTGRYLKDNTIVDDQSDEQERSFDAMFIDLTIGLYERLTFAFNNVDPVIYSEPRPTVTPLNLFEESQDSDTLVTKLRDNSFLTNSNSFIYGLSDVYFDDVEATENQKMITAQAVGEQFADEGKIGFYAYNGYYTDARSLLAMAMLRYKHGITYDTFILDGSDFTFDSKIAYGIRNRIASPLVAPRAKFVLEEVLGSSPELDEFFATGLGAAVEITPGTTWREYVQSRTQ